uniref:Uncharacterized protein n=1 Tax=Rhizophora mucronata TaxID=61149 RepID=A0A2P2Q598_RHIMU
MTSLSVLSASSTFPASWDLPQGISSLSLSFKEASFSV